MRNTPSTIDFLRGINADDETSAARLERLIAEGHDEATLVACCNEVGECVYEGPDDPNALVNRFQLKPYERKKHEYDSYYNPEYYKPSRNAIERNRELVARQVDGVMNPPPTLETHEDFLEYFEQFHPEILKEILRNLKMFEISEGCNAACITICALPTKLGVKGHIPFTTLKWLFENYPDELKQARPSSYYANDTRFYLSEEEGEKRTGIDVLELFQLHLGHWEQASIAYNTDKKTITFIYDLVVSKKGHLWRISRLVQGEDDAAIETLLQKLEEEAKKRGDAPLSYEVKIMIRNAFRLGRKDRFNKTLGNAVKPDTPEKDISTLQVPCIHGVLLTRHGFFGIIMRPPSKKFPHGEIKFPIHPQPKNNRVTFPQGIHHSEHMLPFTLEEVVLQPRLTTMENTSGDIIAQDEPTEREKYMFNLTLDYKKLIEGIKRINPDSQIPAADVRELLAIKSEWTPTMIVEQIEKIGLFLTAMADPLIKIVAKRREALEAYRGHYYHLPTSETVYFDSLIQQNLVNEIEAFITAYQELRKEVEEFCATHPEIQERLDAAIQEFEIRHALAVYAYNETISEAEQHFTPELTYQLQWLEYYKIQRKHEEADPEILREPSDRGEPLTLQPMSTEGILSEKELDQLLRAEEKAAA